LAAERQALEAEQLRQDAEQQRQDAAALHQHADELDPDVEIDLDAESDRNRGTSVHDTVHDEDTDAIELREARTAGDGSDASNVRRRER
jgi:hypothetical protein